MYSGNGCWQDFAGAGERGARNELEIARLRLPLAVAGRVAKDAKRIELLPSESVAGCHYARRAPKVSGSRSSDQKARRGPRRRQRLGVPLESMRRLELDMH